MSAQPAPCSPCDCDGTDACASLPAGFVRLRYFFGKRLGVADFVDQQLYHLAKMRFHNRRLHGAGVLCGLGVKPFPGSTSVLRVGKGAALDGCGREVVVGWDQCIDIDAWVQREIARRKQEEPGSTWPASDLDGHRQFTLCVVLRYQDCITSPEPAPRDPCSCDDGGCDFGRVREGFELDLVTEQRAGEIVRPGLFPTRADLDTIVAAAKSGGPLAAALEAKLLAGCSDEAGDYLVLDCARVTLDANNRATDLAMLPPEAPWLLGTAALQELLLRSVAATMEAGSLAAGPSVTDVTLASTSDADYKLTLPLSGPLAAKTVAPTGQFVLRRLDLTAGWTTPASNVTAAYSAAPATITLTAAATNLKLVDGGLYRLTLVAAADAPIVDEQMRPLRPLRFSWDFKAKGAGTAFTADPPPFAA